MSVRTQVASVDPAAFLTGPAPPPVATLTFKRFFLWLFLVPVIVYFSAIPLVRLPSYERWGLSHWGPILDFAFRTRGQNADVVVFGDSSAFLGIDPRLVDRQLGIKSLVLPNTIGSLSVTGDQALELYLAENVRPRLLVLYFTAWDLDYAASPDTQLYEGEEMLLRHDTAGQIAAFAVKHPLELPAFPLRDYSTIGPRILKSLLHGDDREQQTAQAQGHVDDTENYPPISGECFLPARYVTATRSETVRALVAKYRARGLSVAVYLAPLPACSNARLFAGQTFNGLTIAPAEALTPSLFLEDGLYAHMKPSSVPVASRLFADAISPKLKP